MERPAAQRGNTDGLEALLDNLGATAQQEDVSLEELMNLVGRRSFGSLLLLAGLLTLAPLIGDIPGVPTILGVFVFLVAAQMLAGREYFWLPRFLLDRTVKRSHLNTAIRRMRSPARFVDRVLKVRYIALVNGKAKYLAAIICLGIAALMPLMEVIPFSANAAGVALTAFGLALISRDGLMALAAFSVTGAGYVLIALTL